MRASSVWRAVGVPVVLVVLAAGMSPVAATPTVGDVERPGPGLVEDRVETPADYLVVEGEDLVVIRGTARLMQAASGGPGDHPASLDVPAEEWPEYSAEPRQVLLVQTDDRGDVFVDMGDATPLIDSGATVELSGAMSGEGGFVLREVLSVGPPTPDVAAELAVEKARIDAERAEWAARDADADIAELAKEADERLADLIERGAQAGVSSEAEALAFLDTEAAAAALAEDKAAEDGQGRAAPLSVLILPTYCDPDSPASLPLSPTPAALADQINLEVSNFFIASSSGRRSFAAQSAPWLNRCSGPAQISAEARAVQDGYSPATFDRILIVDPVTFGPGWSSLWTGLAEALPGRRAYLQLFGTEQVLPSWVVAHELGHLEGLFHANALKCDRGSITYSLSARCWSDEYGDLSDTMGIETFTLFSSAQRDRLGWIRPAELVTVTGGSTTTTIWPYSFGANVPQAVKIPLPSGTYYIERRAPLGADADLAAYPGLTDGVQVRVIGGDVDGGAFADTSQLNPMLLDAKVATPRDFSDAALGWNTPFVTPEGVIIRAVAFFSLFARVEVTFPTRTMAPSAPVNFVTNYDPTTNVAGLSWDPPLTTGSGGFGPIWYEVSVNVPTQTGMTWWTTSRSVQIGGFADGLSSVRVRAGRAMAGVSQSTYSTPFFVWAQPTAPAVVNVVEGTTATIPLTLPWPAPVETERSVKFRSGTATVGSDIVGLPPRNPVFLAQATISTKQVAAMADGVSERPYETAQLLVARPWCMAGAYATLLFGGGYPVECLSWDPVSEVRVKDWDPTL